MRFSLSTLLLLLWRRTTYANFLRNSEDGSSRRLQLPPVVAQEIGILATIIPAFDAELINFETTISIRFTNYIGAAWWNCVAVYSDTFSDSLTSAPPSVSVTDSSQYTTSNRAACAAQAAVSYAALSISDARQGVLDALSSISVTVDANPDPAVAACGGDTTCLQNLASSQGFNPLIMGHIVAQQVYDYSIADGWNQLGTDGGCVVNCRSYRDVTGFAPRKCPYDPGNGQKNRWEPLLEDNGKGYFTYQEHVTPQIGQLGAFRYLPESDRTNRVAPRERYSQQRRAEANAVIARMATLNDVKKIQIEQFDNKLIVVNALIGSFIGKILTDGYVDTELGQPGLILSFERFVHYVQTLVAGDYDAIVIAWKEKINFDLVRPTTIIKDRGSTSITTWAPGGTQTFPAADFEAYIRVMPHSEYVSGSACLFQLQEELVNGYLSGIGLDPTSFPIAFPTVPVGASVVEPGVTPSSDVTLTYPDMASMNAAGSASRLDGGMHFDESVPAAQTLCSGIAQSALTGSFSLY